MPPRSIYQNAITATAQITPGNTLSGFTRASLIDDYKQSVWRSSTAGATVTLTIDLGAATNIRALVLYNHNLRTVTGTFQLKYGATSPASNLITVAAMTPSIYVMFFATHNARYWSFSMKQSIASGFYQIGELKLAQYREFTFFFRDKWEFGIDSNEQVSETPGGVRWRLPSFERKSLTLTWDEMEDNKDKTYWNQIFDSRKKRLPFFFCPNPSIPSSTMFVTIKNMLRFKNQHTDRFSLQVQLEEEL